MRVFVDTNVFVYQLDRREPRKQAIARGVLTPLAAQGVGVTSTQVISELSDVLLRRRADLVQRDAVRLVAAELMRDWPLVVVDPRAIEKAFDGVDRFGFSFFDAQIWAAAKTAGAGYLLTEDLSDDLNADGVRILNPFAERFDVDRFLREVASG